MEESKDCSRSPPPPPPPPPKKKKRRRRRSKKQLPKSINNNNKIFLKYSMSLALTSNYRNFLGSVIRKIN